MRIEIQTNPYLIWQLIPGFALLGIAIYIQSRPAKKRGSNIFSLFMFGGSLWAFTNAIQLITPNIEWQKFWNNLTYLGIMVVPTSWFVLSVKLTGFIREPVERVERYLWVTPTFFYLSLLTSNSHKLFFTSAQLVSRGNYEELVRSYGTLFYAHTAYSYLLLVLGIGILVYSLIKNFKTYGFQAYGLIIGVLAPLLGNIYFLFGSPPPGFPDPTPLIFTVTGISFAWAIFGGHILEVVPLAHESIVRKLASGVLILDAEKRIRDINNAALKMLGLPDKTYTGDSLVDIAGTSGEFSTKISKALDGSRINDQYFQTTYQKTGRVFDIHVSHFGDSFKNTSGWLIQFNDISEKKKTEEELAAAQETLRGIINTLPDSYFEADKDGNISYANKSLITALGYSNLGDVQGRNFRKFIDPGEVRGIFERFKQIYDTKHPLEPFEYIYKIQGGGTFIGETSVSPIMSGGEVAGTRGIIRDITSRVNAEKEILRQKETLDSLLQQSPIAMVINDKSNRISVVNPAFEKLFGFKREEVIGGYLEQFLPALPEFKGGDSKTSNTSIHKFITYVRKRKSKDGRILDVEIFHTPFHVGGERFGYLTFYNDITERLKTQSDLAKSQSSYIAVLETLQDSYFEVDRSGSWVYLNKAFCDAVQRPKEDLLGKHFRNVTSRKSVRETALKFEEMFETGKPIPPYEFIYRRNDGQEFEGDLVVSPIIEDGKVVGGRGIIRDISARVQAEEELRQAKDAAESRAGELTAINRIAETVGRSLNLQEILQEVCNGLIEVFEIKSAEIGLLDPDQTVLNIVAFQSITKDSESSLGSKVAISENDLLRYAIQDKKINNIQINDTPTIIIPLIFRNETIGVLTMPAREADYQFTSNDIELSETIASQIAAAIENARLYAKTESALDVAEKDLEIGRQIQAGFFPEKLPNIPGWEIATHFHAARQVAGDFYDVFKFENSKLTAFIIADVCDKGVGAALFMVLFRSLLRAFSRISINSENIDEQLLRIIVNTNSFIAEYHGKSNMFATLFFGILDPDKETLHYINGGHEPPIIINKNGEITQRLMPTGSAVGMFVDMEFQTETVHFEEGDSMLGFTDGSTDAKNSMGEQFTEERLLHCISSPWTSIFSMLFELNVELKEHIGSQNQFDDITMIALRRKSAMDSGQHAICRTADLKVLGELREFTEAAASHSGLGEEGIFAFKLAVDELCANIIQYGYEDREPGMLSLSFDIDDKAARLIIRDDGTYFPPDQAQNPDVDADWEERQIGGLGIYFVKELMDNVTYNRTDNGVNQFVLEKKLK